MINRESTLIYFFQLYDKTLLYTSFNWTYGKRNTNSIPYFYFYYYKQRWMLSERWWSSGWESSPSNQNHMIWKTGFPRMLQALFARRLRWDWTDWGRRGEGGRRGRGERRGHHQKELAHAQYWESAIHSLSTGPFLSSLLSFTLMIASERVQRWKNMNKRDEVALYVCWKMMNWFDQIISERLGRRVKASVKLDMLNTHT